MDIQKFAIPGAIIIAGVMIAGAVFISKPNADIKTPETTEVSMREVTEADHILGNPKAPIVIVEYSDTECPFCKEFHMTMHKILEDFDGQVAWVYRHFPIDQLHPKARKEAEATECAFEQGGNQKFWEYTNEIYTLTQSNNSLDPAKLPIIAEKVGLNVTAFNTCLASGKYAQKVEQDYQDAIISGGRGTPHSILINTKDNTKTVVIGAQPYASLRLSIQALLDK